MPGVPLPPDDHIARYCKPKSLDDEGCPTATSFLPRPSEPYVSFFWLERTGQPDLESQVPEIRIRMARCALTLASTGKIAVLNVGQVVGGVQSHYLRSLTFNHEPLDQTGNPLDDTHAGMYGIEKDDLAICAMLAEELISSVHHAR
jgi:hypothetical protein